MTYDINTTCDMFKCCCDDCNSFNALNKNYCHRPTADCQNCCNCIWGDGLDCMFDWEVYGRQPTVQFYDMNAQQWIKLSTKRPKLRKDN